MYYIGDAMSVILTVRIPKSLRDRMRKIDVDWSEEIRRFIEERVRLYELVQIVESVSQRARSRGVSVDSAELIREDRSR